MTSASRSEPAGSATAKQVLRQDQRVRRDLLWQVRLQPSGAVGLTCRLQRFGYTLARMRYEIVITPEAIEDLKRLRAHERSAVRDSIVQTLRFLPTKTSRSRIKRLHGLSKPQYRLREGDVRVFYDVYEDEVVILAIVYKDDAGDWLAQFGEEDETNTIV